MNGPQMDDQNKNLLIASGLSFLVIIIWFVLFPPPEPTPVSSEQEVIAAGEAGTPPATTSETAPLIQLTESESREAALETSERITVVTDRLAGSISLTGGRIDDLELLDYNERLNDETEKVRLLSPAGGPAAYYVLHGWIPQSGMTYDDVPTARTPWTQTSGGTLTVDTPVTLEWTNPGGLVFEKQSVLMKISCSLLNKLSAIQAPPILACRHMEL